MAPPKTRGAAAAPAGRLKAPQSAAAVPAAAGRRRGTLPAAGPAPRSTAADARAPARDEDDDDDDDELPELTLDDGGGEEGDDDSGGSEGELGGGPAGATFGAAFGAALVAGGDHAEDVEPGAGGAPGPGRGSRRSLRATLAAGPGGQLDGVVVPRPETVRRRGRDGKQRRAAALRGDAAFGDDQGSDSSEDEKAPRNAVGNVPHQWYADEPHVGYDVEGNKLLRSRKGAPADALEAHLAKQDSSRSWRTLYDPVNDETYTLNAEEVALIQRLRNGELPRGEGDYDPYAPATDWADFDGLLGTNGVIHPISSGPEPKRRFIPSSWEAKRVVKFIRALRRGWIKPAAERAAAAAAKAAAADAPYLLWDDALQPGGIKTAAGLARIAPPQEKLPGHEESYNPPLEYVPTEEEVAELHKQAEYTGRRVFVPQRFDAMRSVPAYQHFIQERFERCLDLYLCPRVARHRIQVDPNSLLPELPKPSELRPFPSAQSMEYVQPPSAADVALTTCSVHPTGAWLAAGDASGRVHLWEIATARRLATLQLPDGAGITHVAWCPLPGSHLLAVTVAQRLLLLACDAHLCGKQTPQQVAATQAALFPWAARAPGGDGQQWGLDDTLPGSVSVGLPHVSTRVAWHWQGDYCATVAPSGASSAVLIHQRSSGATQALFNRNKGHVADCAFHPSRPLLFVATRKHVYVYNLAKQALSKTLQAGCGPLTSVSIHPRGDNVLVSSGDKRVTWFDLDLATRPYKTFASHNAGVHAVGFHPRYPLFASGAADGCCHVFHGRVYDDLSTSPVIVPLKVLRAHEVRQHTGVTGMSWHPQQPWLVTAGADGKAKLWVNL